MCAVVITSSGSIILVLKGFVQSVIEGGYSVVVQTVLILVCLVLHHLRNCIIKPSTDCRVLLLQTWRPCDVSVNQENLLSPKVNHTLSACWISSLKWLTTEMTWSPAWLEPWLNLLKLWIIHDLSQIECLCLVWSASCVVVLYMTTSWQGLLTSFDQWQRE